MKIQLPSDEEAALSYFFEVCFYGDQLNRQSDLGEALEDYLQSSEGDDPAGHILLRGAQRLAEGELTEQELIQGRWRSVGAAEAYGVKYADVLADVVHWLRKRA